MLAREFYVEKLKNVMWDNNIKVITGIRRCGKSTILFDLFKQYLLSTGIKDENIITIKLDDDDNFKFRNPILLSKHIKSLISNDNAR